MGDTYLTDVRAGPFWPSKSAPPRSSWPRTEGLELGREAHLPESHGTRSLGGVGRGNPNWVLRGLLRNRAPKRENRPRPVDPKPPPHSEARDRDAEQRQVYLRSGRFAMPMK